MLRFTRPILGSFAFCAFAAGALPALAGEIRVPRDHDTIQKAIDAAQDGDRITVKDRGNYIETLVIDRFDGLTLKGESRPTVDGGAEVALAIRRSEGIVVTGFNFVNEAGQVPIVEIIDSQDVRLEKSVVGPGGGIGISVVDGEDVALSKLRIRKTGSECIKLETDRGETEDSLIEKSDLDQCAAGGIRITGDRNRVEKNVVNASGSDGISIDGGTDNRIIRNTVSRSQADGIDIDSVNNLVMKNKVTKSRDAGIDVSVGSNIFKKNKVRKSETCGINDTSTLDTNVYEKNKVDGRCSGGRAGR